MSELGRRRPRARNWSEETNPQVRPWNKLDGPDLGKKVKTVGHNPRGPGVCPKCGTEVQVMVTHMRGCKGTA